MPTVIRLSYSENSASERILKLIKSKQPSMLFHIDSAASVFYTKIKVTIFTEAEQAKNNKNSYKNVINNFMRNNNISLPVVSVEEISPEEFKDRKKRMMISGESKVIETKESASSIITVSNSRISGAGLFSTKEDSAEKNDSKSGSRSKCNIQ